MKHSATKNISVRSSVAGLLVFLFSLTPLTAAAAEIYGMPAARVEQTRGVDKNVDYQSLAKMGLWDDRNYQLTADDLKYLSKNESELSNKIPAFFRVELRKMWPHLKNKGTVQYPRAAWQMFRKYHGGIKRNGKVWGPDFNANRIPVTNELQLNQILGANEITVEINPANSDHVIAGSNNAGGQEMYYSFDGGETWTIQGVLPNTCCDPTIGWSSDGSVAYVAALSGPIGVSFWRSLDQGVTWQDRVDLTNSGSDKEFLHVDISDSSPHQDNIYLTYHNGNTMQFARSTDGGVNFDIQAFGSAPSGIGSDITTTSNGDIYYFYGAFGTNQIIMLKSTDGGVSFDPPVVVDSTLGSFDWPIPSMETRNAWIYVAADADRSGGPFDGRVYSAWTDTTSPESGIAANNHTVIKVAYSDDGGANWTITSPHNTSDSNTVDRFNQWLTVDEFGNVHVVYYDTQNSENRTGVDLYYTLSLDGGATWETPERVSSETSANLSDGQEWGDYNGVSVVGDKVITTWTDNRNGPPNEKDVFSAEALNIGAEPTFVLGGDNLSAEVCAPDSFDINLEVGQIQGFANPVTLGTVGLPGGFGTNFSVNPVAPTGSSVATVNVGSVAAGDYSFDIIGSASGADDRVLSVNVGVTDAVPSIAGLVSPADGATDQALTPVLSWSAAAQATSYVIEIATDVDFTNIVETGNSSSTSYAVTGALATDSTYYWRVRAGNTCGAGANSVVSSFSTGTIICTTPGTPITDNTTISSSLPLADAGILSSLAVSVNASHTWVGDLNVSLVHEDTGTTVVLMNRPGQSGPDGFGCQEGDVNAEFNDNSLVVVENECSTTPPAIGGVVNPDGNLSAFAGESLAGTWRLDVNDGAGGDTGTLNEWCLLPGLQTGVADTDNDGVFDDADNCITFSNPDQTDTNGDGIGNACDPDLNNDCIVNFFDVFAFQDAFPSVFGDANFNADADHRGPTPGSAPDGAVNFFDFIGLYESYFLQPPGPSANVCSAEQ